MLMETLFALLMWKLSFTCLEHIDTRYQIFRYENKEISQSVGMFLDPGMKEPFLTAAYHVAYLPSDISCCFDKTINMLLTSPLKPRRY